MAWQLDRRLIVLDINTGDRWQLHKSSGGKMINTDIVHDELAKLNLIKKRW
tara:strand:- start:5 stop:157 length:153 start_codon:yes stop_codon:yes gene_type:complete